MDNENNTNDDNSSYILNKNLSNQLKTQSRILKILNGNMPKSLLPDYNLIDRILPDYSYINIALPDYNLIDRILPDYSYINMALSGYNLIDTSAFSAFKQSLQLIENLNINFYRFNNIYENINLATTDFFAKYNNSLDNLLFDCSSILETSYLLNNSINFDLDLDFNEYEENIAIDVIEKLSIDEDLLDNGKKVLKKVYKLVKEKSPIKINNKNLIKFIMITYIAPLAVSVSHSVIMRMIEDEANTKQQNIVQEYLEKNNNADNDNSSEEP